MDQQTTIAIAVGAVGAILLLGGIVAFAKPSRKKFLNKKRQELPVAKITQLSHDTLRFTFALPRAAPVLGLPVGKHFKLYAPNAKGVVAGQWNGRDDAEAGDDEIERKYTPTTSDSDVGSVDLVIKVYKRGVVDRFPDGGKMSQYMASLKVGDMVTISGPWGMNEYLGKGRFKVGSKELTCTKLNMLAGGTGITPMLQVMSAILKDAADPTQISLIYANQTPDDILVRDELEALAKQHPTRLKLWYTVDRPGGDWAYSTGFMTAEMFTEHLFAPADDTLSLMCGPPPMVKFACQDNLSKLGHDKSRQVAF